MTAIVGFRHEGKVWLAGDRAASDAYSSSVTTAAKVFVAGEYVVGFAGGFRPGQVIHDDWAPPAPARTFHAFRKRLVDSLRECLDENRAALKGTDFLIGCRGRLYLMQDDWSLLPQKSRVASIGAGGSWAEAAVEALAPFGKRLRLKPETMLRRAIEISSRHCTSVCRECDVVFT